MAKLSIVIHNSIKIEGSPSRFSDEFQAGIRIIDAMGKLLENYPEVKEICMEGDKKKPGILYIAQGAELSSLGMLESMLEGELEIKIVPILHGG